MTIFRNTLDADADMLGWEGIGAAWMLTWVSVTVSEPIDSVPEKSRIAVTRSVITIF